MNPVVAAAQIRAAKIAREAAALAPRVAYSTATGDAPRPARAEAHDYDQGDYLFEYCYLCGRHTDHLGEHDEFEARGLVEYVTTSTSWTVVKTDLYDARPDLVQDARDEVDANVAAWLAAMA